MSLTARAAGLFRRIIECPISPGQNFTLAETIKLAVDQKNAVAMWGPYEIKKGAFDLGVKRKKLLDGGTIHNIAPTTVFIEKTKSPSVAFMPWPVWTSFIPNGGLFGTGFKMWGFNGTARVLIEYTEKASNKHLLLEPVDVKKDRYGFVYAPALSGQVPYDPLKNASAYHQ